MNAPAPGGFFDALRAISAALEEMPSPSMIRDSGMSRPGSSETAAARDEAPYEGPPAVRA